MNKLVIAEKPSVAGSIATVLCARERKDGFFIGNGYIVSWCIGHLVGLAQAQAYDEKYAKWRYGDLPIIPKNWKHAVSSDKAKQLKIISDLLKREDVATVVNACDAGREGELIFRLVYEQCKCKKPIERLWISSMEESAIEEGFQKLRPGTDYDTLYQSALCRTQADWIIGINATRLFSVLYGSTLNVGRVQSPTLDLIVSMENAITNFKKEPFYETEIDCGIFKATSGKTVDKSKAETIQSVCNGNTATVTSVESKDKSTACPKLYDLTTLQREANRIFGFTAQQTLDYVQSLYEKKLVTYPRTDSNFLTEDMASGIKELTENVWSVLPFTSRVELNINVPQVIDNSKVTDHHAIIPTPTMSKSDLTAIPEGERNILYMIAVRLLCAVSEKHVCAETIVTLNCKGFDFKAKGKMVVCNGWKAFEETFKRQLKNKDVDENSNDKEKDKSIPQVSEGQKYYGVFVSVREGFTSPPKHFTEDTLLLAMETAGAENLIEDAERKGLGTPATRAGIIEKLVKTQFLQRKDKQLLPTEKAINLMAILPDNIKSPTMTAEWENQLKLVERGEVSAESFMNGISELIINLVKENATPKEEYVALLAKPKVGEIIGVCPRCKNNIREGKKGFFCDTPTCGFALWKENKFFKSKKKELTKDVAMTLLNEGCIFMSGLYSERTGKTYNATISLDDTGDKYVNFKMDFEKK